MCLLKDFFINWQENCAIDIKLCNKNLSYNLNTLNSIVVWVFDQNMGAVGNVADRPYAQETKRRIKNRIIDDKKQVVSSYYHSC